MTNKLWLKWLIIFLATLFLGLGSIWILNTQLMPRLTFGQKFDEDSIMTVSTERQSRSAYLTRTKLKIDTIILGSSRVQNLRLQDFNKNVQSLYNFNVPGFNGLEYISALSFIPKKVGSIYFFVDFFATNENYNYPSNFPKSIPIADNFSLDVLIRSVMGKITNLFKDRQKSDEISFTQPTENIKETSMDIEQRFAMLADKRVEQLLIDYKYNPAYAEILAVMKNTVPQAKFTVAIPPVSKAFILSAYVHHGYWNDYERWLRDLVAAFGEVWDFNYINSITENPKHWINVDHMLRPTSSIMVKRMLGNTEEYSDFGILVTADNLEEHLQFLHANFFNAAP